MGYSAYVECNCYKEGKTSEPPHKQFMAHDQYGWYLKFVPETFSDEESDMTYEFNEWVETACPHKLMRYCYHSLSSIVGMNRFHSLVKSYGGETIFPLLSHYLPIDNDGFVPSDLTKPLKKELELLQSKIPNVAEINEMKLPFIFSMITMLKDLCDASIATGNPIKWT